MGKFHPFLTELSTRNTYVLYFQDNNLSEPQWICTKLDMCIDIVEIALRLLIAKFCQTFDRAIFPRHDNGGILSFHVLLSNVFGLCSIIHINFYQVCLPIL